ncbi:molybdopterin-synthase adenylyltransferase MoeB [Oerskovia sp. KBS0722]|uniref:molybdopterin-synthase adenylyltransferase MoeB n=1 Tax=Oerskovia sp. KBS0722 TaxID=1179673 RepID=UPI00110E8580|nr:molybdopterin-synthase adenylyltransferase MoeB [Oerskovia sp. KBS0722]QDW62660.1 molybdopterin-synthase adenylyltransferase MoeB [Oerskovia sp. KBS0722]
MTSLPPLVAPSTEPLSPQELARYSRHLALPGIGVEGQQRLRAARVLVVGAGGLGSPALLYLAAAGVGTIGIVDDDRVEVSNLQRQVIHGGSDVGRPKVESARDAVAEVNPHVSVRLHEHRLDASNVLTVLDGYDVVLDGTDNFATRYLVGDAAEIAGIPCVWGSIFRFHGQVSVFWSAPPVGEGVVYRDVFPEPPPPGTVPDCATGGVLGAMCGTVGSVMATEAIKLITGAGRTLLGRLAVYDSLELTWRHLTVRADPARVPVIELLAGDHAYEAFCGFAPAAAAVPAVVSSGTGLFSGPTADGRLAVDLARVAGEPGPTPTTLTAQELADRLADPDDDVLLLDVREEWETQIVTIDGARVVPSGVYAGPGATAALADLPRDRTVAVLCKVGGRSDRVARLARAAGVDARNVEGGIVAWVRDVEPDLPTY